MIECKTFYNSECVKCDKVNPIMVHVGAFIMCLECFVKEFGFIAEIDPKSSYGITYYRWLNVYKQKTAIQR